MKKDKKKFMITGSLIVLCIGVLTGVNFLTRTPEKEFAPSAAVETESQNTEWNESSSLPAESSLHAADPAETETRQGSTDDTTQAVISEQGNETVTDLSDSKPKTETETEKPSSPPVTTEDTTNPEKEPSYDDSVPVTPTDTPADTPDNSDSSEHAGQVYDPVFGWIDAGTTQGQAVDNSGDINKQVGTMD